MSQDYPLVAVLKAETDGNKTTKILCVSIYDIHRDELFRFSDAPDAKSSPISAAIEVLTNVADRVICHTDYPLRALEKLHGLRFDHRKFTDTCTLAGILFGKYGGHKLDQWAQRLGFERVPFRGAPNWEPRIQQHCDADCYLIAALYHHLLQKDGEQRRQKEDEMDRFLARLHARAPQGAR